MSGCDADMMESSSDPNDVVRNLLSHARQLVDQAKPSQALQAVNSPSSIHFLFALRFNCVLFFAAFVNSLLEL